MECNIIIYPPVFGSDLKRMTLKQTENVLKYFWQVCDQWVKGQTSRPKTLKLSASVPNIHIYLLLIKYNFWCWSWWRPHSSLTVKRYLHYLSILSDLFVSKSLFFMGYGLQNPWMIGKLINFSVNFYFWKVNCHVITYINSILYEWESM